jgi:opacity protein-like surface antigen
MKRVLLATTALALLAGASQAQAGEMYVSVFGGANWLADSSANYTEVFSQYSSTLAAWRWDTDADTGFVLGGAIGTHLDKWQKGLRVELEASYRRNDVGGGWQVSTTSEPYSSFGAIDANMSTFAIMANVWYEHDMGWKIRPYIGGGAGWGRAHFDGALTEGFTSLGGEGGEGETTFNTSNDGFAWQLGAGFNYEASPGVDVGLGYRYFSGPDFIEPFNVDNDIFGGQRSFGRVENRNHSVMVNLTVDIN